MSNTLSLRQELLELAAQADDEHLLAAACLVLRGEGDTIIWGRPPAAAARRNPSTRG